jgi:hypothetical protein
MLESSLVSLARMPSLSSLRPGRHPGVPRSMMKAEMPREPLAFAVTAIATSTSPDAPCVMNCLVPFNTQSVPSRTAVLRIEAASLPEDASVNPQAARCWPRARAGRYRRFWSSVPNMAR